MNQTSLKFQSYSNSKILKTIENRRNAFLFLAVSHNQWARFPTDPARLQHIMCPSINEALCGKTDFEFEEF